MQIRVGFEMAYRCPQPTPMILVLNIHYSRASDLVRPDLLITSPAVRLYERLGFRHRDTGSDGAYLAMQWLPGDS